MTEFAANRFQLDLLQSRLRSARHGFIANRIVTSLLVASCVGMAAYLAVRVAAQFGLIWPSLLIPTSAVVALGGMLVLGLLRLPSQGALAIAADRASKRQEIFRTALESPAARGSQDVFLVRLTQQAEQFAGQIVPAHLVPGINRPLIGVTLALVVATMVGSLIWPSEVPEPTQAATTIEGPELQSVVAAIDDIAIRLEEEAMAQGDQYLMAISRSLADISRDTADRPSVDRSRLAGELEAVGSHAATALGIAQGATDAGQTLFEQFTQLQQRIADGETAPAAGTETAGRSPVEGGGGNSPIAEEDGGDDVPIEGGAGISTAPGARQSDIVPEDLPTGPVEGPCQIDGEDSCMGPADTNYSADRSLPTGEAAQALGSTSQSDQDVAGRDGMLIGAASQSGQGDSALAGQGTEDLLGPDASQSLDALSEFLTVASDRVAEGGTSAPQERAPEQATAIGAAGNLDVTSGQWRQLPEQPGNHARISASRRNVLMQYFDRPVED